MVKGDRTLTSAVKKQIIDEIIAREGGYVNDAADSGGETNFGITIDVARRYGYAGPMKSMPREIAFDIYSARYWDAMRLDFVEQRSVVLAEELADTAVNMGVARAGEFLQRCLNALNNCGKDYPDLKVDGQVGAKTIDTLYKFLDRRGPDGAKILYRALNCLQGAFYIELCEKREKDEKFLYGWLSNRVK